MDKKIRQLAEKYFNGECTREETRHVLAWFDTTEGEKYLSERLDQDLEQIEDFPSPEMYNRVPTSRIKERLERARKVRTGDKPGSSVNSRSRRYSTIFATAASFLLLVAASSLFYYYSFRPNDDGPLQQQETAYSAGVEEHKVLSLSDGTTVRLNSNSELTMPEVFSGDKREVTLSGEAYFEVTPNPDKPFIVHTNHAVIRVLGTAFNVKASSEDQNVQVAVKEGKVSFRQKNSSNPQEVFLTKNHLGYLDLRESEINVERVSIDNYLSWITKRLVFDNLPFDEVCTQIGRIYGIGCTIRDEQLSQIRFTANFEKDSLEKTLKVISNSLDIGYRLEGKQVIWMKKE